MYNRLLHFKTKRLHNLILHDFSRHHRVAIKQLSSGLIIAPLSLSFTTPA